MRRRDLIVEEVRRNRAAIAREHGNDLDAIVAAFQREEATGEVPTVSFPPKRYAKRTLRQEQGKTRRPNTYQPSPRQGHRSSPSGRRIKKTRDRKP
jgi:hypothetical protein